MNHVHYTQQERKTEIIIAAYWYRMQKVLFCGFGQERTVGWHGALGKECPSSHQAARILVIFSLTRPSPEAYLQQACKTANHSDKSLEVRVMQDAHRKGIVFGICVVVIGAACAAAQDWPQWRGPNRDDKVTGFTAPKTWPSELKQKWSVTVGQGDSTPALVGDRLYVFTRQGQDEVVLCLDAQSGKVLWTEKYAAQAVTGAASRHPGPRSSPAVADGKVFTLGVGGVLSCLDASNGKVLWRKDPFPKVVPRFFAATSPIIADGMCIAQQGGQGHGAIIAYDLTTGDEKWRWDKEGPDYGSPVLLTVDGTKQIVAPTEKSIVGVSLTDGKLLWEVPFVPKRMAYNAATPIIDGQTVIYAGKGRGTKALKIEKQGDGFKAKELWSNPDLAVQFNTPVLRDGFLYGLSDSGHLFCINAQTGQTAWTDATQRDRGGFGPVVSAGSCLIALPSNAELTVFKPSDTGYSELAHIKVSEKAVYAHPVIAGNRIYIRDLDSVTLWTID
jgi:outer membrane protein assembly factor BamB